MNAETGTALAIPAGVSLASLLQKEDALEAALSRIEQEARSQAPDLTTARGRKAIASLAHSIARSKTALDGAGKEANADLRAKINAVDEQRRKVRERLDALKAEVRKPLDDWEEAEEARVAGHKSALAKLQDTSRVDALSPAETIRAVLAEVEATTTGPEWDEFQEIAAAAKEKAIDKFNADLTAAEKREAEAAELARLRAAEEERRAKEEAEAAAKAEQEAAERAEQERLAAEQRKQEEAEAARKQRVENAKSYLAEIAEGRIGGKAQSFGVLIYELETKLPPLIDELGDAAAALHVTRLETLSAIKDQADAQRKRDEDAAREKAAADAKAAEERAAQAERNRIAEEKRRSDEARAKREADEKHRAKIHADIVEALTAMRGNAAPEQIADALMAGKIPHTEVRI